MPRSCNVERAPDFDQNPVEPFLDLIIRETEFKETVRLDCLASSCIRERLTGVVHAIEFERQPRFVTAKIGNKTADRRLTSKLPTVQTTVARFAPENVFGARACSAKVTREGRSLESHVLEGNPRAMRYQPRSKEQLLRKSRSKAGWLPKKTCVVASPSPGPRRGLPSSGRFAATFSPWEKGNKGVTP